METQLLSTGSAQLSEMLPIALVTFSKTGKVLFMNSASRTLFASMKLDPEELPKTLPAGHRALVRQAVRERRSGEMDWVQNGRSLHFIFKATDDGDSVYVFVIDLTAQEEAKTQLVQSERMASLGLLIAGLAHEINTPLGAIYSNNDTIARSIEKIRLLATDQEMSAEEKAQAETRLVDIIQDVCKNTSTASERLMSLVGSLKNFARLDEADLKRADIHQGLESTLTLVQHEFKNRIQVEKQYGNIPLVECHPNAINQVFMNLLVNASQAIPDRGTITIKTSKKGEFVRIAISDTGVGIPEENLSKVFDPGFTTKGVGIGTGLGLSICYKIIQEHHGRIEVESSDRGTTFTVVLPLGQTRKVKNG
jgi:signal transduction histidine kinase